MNSRSRLTLVIASPGLVVLPQFFAYQDRGRGCAFRSSVVHGSLTEAVGDVESSWEVH